ncbi:MAG TPA: DUF6510 family protein [bacterium]|jgi:predicted RNA-binding Zn-ribbon protein involved in translation (DUF1610 family)|nr:DUF6510 family protein [bacterium]
MTESDDRHLDGNAAAGVLADIFGEEMTARWTICGSCGRQHVVGGLVVYIHGMGVVLRCPSCGRVQIKVGTLAQSYRVDMRGVRTFEIGG